MTPERLFTPQQAVRTLPLVRKIIADVMATGRELKALAKSRQPPDVLDAEAQRLTARLEKLIGEFGEIGCFYKDWNFDIGLVDFPAVIAGKKVLLCWRSDEPGITHYHGFDEGFAQRREIPAEWLREECHR